MKAFILAYIGAIVAAQQTAWGQCGYNNEWYSQCTPGSAQGTTTTLRTTTTTTTTSRAPTTTSGSGSGGYVTRSGTKFNIDGKVGCFAGTNAYWLSFTTNNADIDQVMSHLQASKLKVLRVWGFNDVTSPSGVYFQLFSGSSPTINTGSNGLQRLDAIVASAEKYGIKLIIPFVNYWDDYGGMKVYANYYGVSKNAFYTDSRVISQYKQYINALVSRYRNSKAIFAWELANEPRCNGCPTSTITNWATSISQYIKSLDSNHLITLGDEGWFNGGGDGSYPYSGGEGIDFVKNLAISTLDFGTAHLYPGHWSKSDSWGNTWIQEHASAATSAGKPYILEEYGVTSNRGSVYGSWYNTILGSETAGDMYWQFGETLSSGQTHNDGFTVYYSSSEFNSLVGPHANAILWNIGPNGGSWEEQGQQQQDERQRPEVGLDSMLEDRNRVGAAAEQKGQDYIEGQAISKHESEDEDGGARGEGQGFFHPPLTLIDEHRQYGQQDNLEEQLSITIATTFTTTNATTTTTDPTTSDTNITTADLDTDDVETVYSETSSFATSEKENYISELAAVLFHEIRELLRSDNSETAIWERISIALPELLKAFALKVGYKAPSQMHRDIMFFVHKNRELVYILSVAKYFTEKYSHGDAESVPNTQVVENTNMDLAAKMDLWHEKSEYPPSHPQHGPLEDQFEENTFWGDAEDEYENGGDKAQGTWMETSRAQKKKMGNTAIDRAIVCRDFILKTPAFEWLVGVLRREIILLTPAELPNYMEITKRSVSECLPSSHRISKNRSAEAFNTIFLTGWKPLIFVNEQEYELKPSEAIERAVILTGSTEDVQALTCVDYLCQTWLSTGKYIIELVKDVIDESEILYLPLGTLPDNTALIAYFRESSELVVEAVGTKDSVAEIGQQLAWLCTALSPSPLETGVVAFVPLIKNSQSLNSRGRGTTTPPTDPRGLTHANLNLPTFSFRLHFSAEEREQSIIPPNSQYWHNMFKNPVIIKGYPIP
ncbi:hypothetical protein AOL_s00004g16 [Orbilia oligospora ATCC 24927]|uniref:mannan endo-1,4-beta-mannosidase n=1 Tax=Arthrobotrys oligospora (strain ATCC 24927 / CBS 115.81 / DSM 1491) TaxID=756982 RepID=G1WXK6_ARTOA|nr:hypothetical protein AOL_s00004g16 [Orbilia oligospora ATCC 24927]EGX54367.1 hypothetical protein AOL_s00004g16 [Orbilia oligospora ATCC 24927]